MNKKLTWDKILFAAICYTVVLLFTIICILPFIMMVSGSLSSDSQIKMYGYSILPRGFSLSAYELLFQNPKIMLNSFKISMIVTLFGTLLSLLICSMAAYVLGRSNFTSRNKAAFFYYFTTLFSGGLVPYYIIMINYYQMKNNILALIIPNLVNVWNILVLRSFMKNDVPQALPESAKIDGAGEFTIYWKIVLPLMRPSLLAIGFFTAIAYWNDWYTAMLFIDNQKLFPLQYQLFRMLNTINFILAHAAELSSKNPSGVKIDLPSETTKLAMAVVAAGPILFLYSFIQKYFVKGITVGAVKG